MVLGITDSSTVGMHRIEIFQLMDSKTIAKTDDFVPIIIGSGIVKAKVKIVF